MPDDIRTVAEVVRIFLIIASVCTTVFPLLYLFSPWYKSHLGRAVMIQSISIAFAIDITLLFQFVEAPDDLLTILIINVVILGFISAASVYLTVMLFYYNFMKKENNEDGQQVQATAE